MLLRCCHDELSIWIRFALLYTVIREKNVAVHL